MNSITNARSMNGLIAFNDGNGGILSSGQLTVKSLATSNLNTNNINNTYTITTDTIVAGNIQANSISVGGLADINQLNANTINGTVINGTFNGDITSNGTSIFNNISVSGNTSINRLIINTNGNTRIMVYNNFDFTLPTKPNSFGSFQYANGVVPYWNGLTNSYLVICNNDSPAFPTLSSSIASQYCNLIYTTAPTTNFRDAISSFSVSDSGYYYISFYSVYRSTPTANIDLYLNSILVKTFINTTSWVQQSGYFFLVSGTNTIRFDNSTLNGSIAFTDVSITLSPSNTDNVILNGNLILSGTNLTTTGDITIAGRLTAGTLTLPNFSCSNIIYIQNNSAGWLNTNMGDFTVGFGLKHFNFAFGFCSSYTSNIITINFYIRNYYTSSVQIYFSSVLTINDTNHHSASHLQVIPNLSAGRYYITATSTGCFSNIGDSMICTLIEFPL